MLAGLNDIEQLADQSQGTHLVVMLAGRKAKKFDLSAETQEGT